MILPALNPAGLSVDGQNMTIPDSTGWVALALIAFGTIVAILQVAAIQVKNETTLHDLRVRVNELRIQRLEFLKAFPSARKGNS